MNRTIKLQNSNKAVLVDDKDYVTCVRITWRINRRGYAKAGNGIGLMHRFILNGKLERNPDMTVHHKNSNKLDNRRSNLQIVDAAKHQSFHKRSSNKVKNIL